MPREQVPLIQAVLECNLRKVIELVETNYQTEINTYNEKAKQTNSNKDREENVKESETNNTGYKENNNTDGNKKEEEVVEEKTKGVEVKEVVDVNEINYWGFTALIHAAMAGYTGISVVDCC